MKSRRSFLLGMGVAAAASQELGAQTARVRTELPDILRAPDGITALGEGRAEGVTLARSGDRWQGGDIEVAVEARKGSLVFTVGAPKTRLTRLRVRWHCAFPEGTRFLGDHWERSYGDLEWRGLAGERLMPWYFLASAGRRDKRLWREDRRGFDLQLAGGRRRHHAVARCAATAARESNWATRRLEAATHRGAQGARGRERVGRGAGILPRR